MRGISGQRKEDTEDQRNERAEDDRECMGEGTAAEEERKAPQRPEGT